MSSAKKLTSSYIRSIWKYFHSFTYYLLVIYIINFDLNIGPEFNAIISQFKLFAVSIII